MIQKYRKQISSTLLIDYAAIDMLEVEFNRLPTLSFVSRHPLLFHFLLAIVTNIFFPIFSMKRKVRDAEYDFVLVSCPDNIFRTRNIDLLAGTLKYCIIYLPNFHIPASIRYHYFFKEKGIKAFFPTISFKHVWQAWWKIRRFEKECGIKTGGFERKKMISVLLSYLIYNGVAKDFIMDLEYFHGKWILEHEKFYFLPVVANLRLLGKESTMLQHGLFFKPTTDFFPLLCDKVLCCSEREKDIYIKEGVSPDRVVVLGIPLQTITRERVEQNSKPDFQLLILLTLVDNRNVSMFGDIRIALYRTVFLICFFFFFPILLTISTHVIGYVRLVV